MQSWYLLSSWKYRILNLTRTPTLDIGRMDTVRYFVMAEVAAVLLILAEFVLRMQRG